MICEMKLREALKSVCVYKNVMDKPVMAWVSRLLERLEQGHGEPALEAYTSLFSALCSEGCSTLGQWLDAALRYEENSYAQFVARGEDNPALTAAARRDIEIFQLLAQKSFAGFAAELRSLLGDTYKDVLVRLPQPGQDEQASFDFDSLTEFYRLHGAGLFAKYRAFLWEDSQLFPVEQPDSPEPAELLGYEMQREQVIANTRALVAGHRVNNVLLFGDSGTGKSATVKSLLTQPGLESLRLIEVQKEGLSDLTRLIRTLRTKPQKFILFIDDLAFDQDDRVFSVLKTILEGGLEPRPANVAVYATSNRRHLVRQTFSERAGEEVDTFETISEKTALSERFGLRIPYQNMDKKGYLALVDHLAAREGIEMDAEVLHHQAMQWDVRHGGRSPRSARQFIASLSVE